MTPPDDPVSAPEAQPYYPSARGDILAPMSFEVAAADLPPPDPPAWSRAAPPSAGVPTGTADATGSAAPTTP